MAAGDNTLMNAGTGGDTNRAKDRGAAKTSVMLLDAGGSAGEALIGDAGVTLPVTVSNKTPTPIVLTTQTDTATFVVPDGMTVCSLTTNRGWTGSQLDIYVTTNGTDYDSAGAEYVTSGLSGYQLAAIGTVRVNCVGVVAIRIGPNAFTNGPVTITARFSAGGGRMRVDGSIVRIDGVTNGPVAVGGIVTARLAGDPNYGNITAVNAAPTSSAPTAGSTVALTYIPYGNNQASQAVFEVFAFVGALVLQLAGNASNWNTVTQPCFYNVVTGAMTSTITGPGIYKAVTGGVQQARLSCTAYTSGGSNIGVYPVVAGDLTTISGIGRVDSGNSTSTVLGSNAVFTGPAIDVSDYAHINVAVFADVASATDGLAIQQSANGTNWDFTDLYTIPAATGKTFAAPVQAQWARVVYTNGATAQAAMRLQTVLSKAGKMPSSIRPQDARGNDNDMMEVSGANMLFNGVSWDRQRGNYNAATGDAGTKTATFNGATQTNFNARGAVVDFVIGAVTGSTPTLALKLQRSPDNGTTWLDIAGAVTASITATGNFSLTIFPGAVAVANSVINQLLPRTWRVVGTITGTTPSFPITLSNVSYVL